MSQTQERFLENALGFKLQRPCSIESVEYTDGSQRWDDETG